MIIASASQFHVYTGLRPSRRVQPEGWLWIPMDRLQLYPGHFYPLRPRHRRYPGSGSMQKRENFQRTTASVSRGSFQWLMALKASISGFDCNHNDFFVGAGVGMYSQIFMWQFFGEYFPNWRCQWIVKDQFACLMDWVAVASVAIINIYKIARGGTRTHHYHSLTSLSKNNDNAMYIE